MLTLWLYPILLLAMASLSRCLFVCGTRLISGPSRPCKPSPHQTGLFTICRFAGSSAVAANVPGFGFGAASAMAARIATSFPAAAGSGSSEASEYVVPSQVDGEVAQCIRHLAKKDATTKLKALQVRAGRARADLLGWLLHDVIRICHAAP